MLQPLHSTWKKESKSPRFLIRKMKGPQFSRFSPRSGPTRSVPSGFTHAGSGRPAPQHPLSAPPSSSPLFSPSNHAPCQICGKTSHQALDCFHGIDHTYQGRHPPSQLTAMVAQNNTQLEAQEWYTDRGANAHITRDLENLTIQPQPFQGQESVAVGNGTGIGIEHTGSAILHSSKTPFHIRNILHCPTAATNLISG
jgi:hypothetical protein